MVKEIILIMKMNENYLVDIDVHGAGDKGDYTLFNYDGIKAGKEIEKIINEDLLKDAP